MKEVRGKKATAKAVYRVSYLLGLIKARQKKKANTFIEYHLFPN